MDDYSDDGSCLLHKTDDYFSCPALHGSMRNVLKYELKLKNIYIFCSCFKD